MKKPKKFKKMKIKPPIITINGKDFKCEKLEIIFNKDYTTKSVNIELEGKPPKEGDIEISFK
ncbi:unnamed protein product [marine sediment metagenome]|uniref:Uncharacterized protein n=1 Tax=marine sediment metagenome TaxID=412755 RepID=X0Y752_9ZZZZ